MDGCTAQVRAASPVRGKVLLVAEIKSSKRKTIVPFQTETGFYQPNKLFPAETGN